MVTEPDGWSENRKLILRELERFGDDINSIREDFGRFRQEDIASIKTDIALLKLKSSLWGAVLGGASGLLVTAGAILLRLIG
jgi:hypothetical protein